MPASSHSFCCRARFKNISRNIANVCVCVSVCVCVVQPIPLAYLGFLAALNRCLRLRLRSSRSDLTATFPFPLENRGVFRIARARARRLTRLLKARCVAIYGVSCHSRFRSQKATRSRVSVPRDLERRFGFAREQNITSCVRGGGGNCRKLAARTPWHFHI